MGVRIHPQSAYQYHVPELSLSEGSTRHQTANVPKCLGITTMQLNLSQRESFLTFLTLLHVSCRLYSFETEERQDGIALL